MIDGSLHGPYLKLEQLHELISRMPHAAAALRLRALLKPGYRPTRSELERLYRRWCHDYDVPLGIINYRRNGRELDAYYPEHKLIVELDSLEYHADPKTFNGDRRKDREQLAEGLATVRLTWEALHLDPAGEAELFQAILAQRSGRSG
jgi:very-short-patch-repair endonuclease